jgi:hypothetical protein
MGRRKGRPTRSDRPKEDWSRYLPQDREPRGPMWWRRLMAWLYRPVGSPDVDPDGLVELTRLASRIDAQTVERELHLRGIHAVLFGTGLGAGYPGAVDGHRVMVRASDYRRARSELSAR